MLDVHFYEGKRVFVTGNTGFKGAWLCALLHSLGAVVKGYAHKEYDLYRMAQLDASADTTLADIRDLESLRRALNEFRPDIVFHLAAQPLVIESYHNPIHTYEVNVMGTANLLEAVRSCPGVRAVVNVTTDKVYQNLEWHWGYRENDRLCGHDPYSNSKSCSELVTHSYIQSFFAKGDSHVNAATARAGNVIGGGDFAENRIIPDCIRAAQRGETIVVRNQSSIRPWQHVLEPLVGYLTLGQALYRGEVREHSFNFGPADADCIDVGTLTKLFCDAWGDGARWEHHPDPNAPHEATFLKLDCSLAGAVLGWKPRLNVKKAVEWTVRWHQGIAGGTPALALMQGQIQEYLSLV